MPSEAFNAAVLAVRESPPSSDEAKLQLYANYKQATVGDAPASGPSRLKVFEYAKHVAWAEVRGTSAADAETAYIEFVSSLDAPSMETPPTPAAVRMPTPTAALQGAPLFLARSLLVVGALLIVSSLAVPIFRFLYANPWLFTLLLGQLMMLAGGALLIEESGLLSLLPASAKQCASLSLLDAIIAMRASVATARGKAPPAPPPAPPSPPPTTTEEDASTATPPPPPPPRVPYLPQLARLIAMCWLDLDEEDPELLRELVSELDTDFRSYATGPLVAAVPTYAQYLLVGRTGVAELATAAQEAVASEAVEAAEEDAPPPMLRHQTTAFASDLRRRKQKNGNKSAAVVSPMMLVTAPALTMRLLFRRLVMLPLRRVHSKVAATRLYTMAYAWAAYAYYVAHYVATEPRAALALAQSYIRAEIEKKKM